jgi:hypothetical protein
METRHQLPDQVGILTDSIWSDAARLKAALGRGATIASMRVSRVTIRNLRKAITELDRQLAQRIREATAEEQAERSPKGRGERAVAA